MFFFSFKSDNNKKSGLVTNTTATQKQTVGYSVKTINEHEHTPKRQRRIETYVFFIH